MKRTRTSLLRRVVMWAAGVVFVLTVASLGVSLFRIVWTPRSWFGLALRDGCLHASNISIIIEEHEGFGERFEPAPRFRYGPTHWEHWQWWPMLTGRGRYWWLVLPLWIPATCAGSALMIMQYAAFRRGIRSRAGACPSCAYDLTGITGPCPECGGRT